MRHMEHEGEHIWLRQSVTFTVNGQTRTVEIAVPVRPDASAEEIEALMSLANTGMDALSRQLDTRITALLTGEESATTTDVGHAGTVAPIVTAAPAVPAPVPSAEPAPISVSAVAHPAPSPAVPAPSAASSVPHEGRESPTSAHTQPPQPSAQQPSPARAAASGPLRSQPSAQQPNGHAPDSPAPQKPAAAPGPDISRAEFISATAEMGLNPTQAMERLGVRSLQGLNLREALEALRRQMVRESGDTSVAAPPTAPPPQASRQARVASPPPASQAPASPRHDAAHQQSPRYFEEEEELDGPEFTFSLDGESDLDDEFGPGVGEESASYGADAANGLRDDLGALDDLDDLDLDDVPDFGPPPTAPTRAAVTPATSRRPTPRDSALPPAEAAAPALAVMEGRSLALQLLGQFRAVRGGGAPTGQQRMAYRNIIVHELGDGDARALVQGVWRITPERMGGEQLDALVSWGKRDTFAEEATLVLAVLQEERERNNNSASATATEAAPSQATTRANGAATPPQRPATRQRTASTRSTPPAGDI